MPRLEIVDGPEKGKVFPLEREETVIGRLAYCDVILPQKNIDLDSTNGTWLNGRRLVEPERLRDGDVIEIGGARFTFRDPDATLEAAHFPKLVVDEETGEAWVDRCAVQLSGKQRALLLLLWRRRGHVCTKDEIAAAVWPECRGEIYDYQIESLVKRLRAKLERRPAAPALIINVPGLGYRLAI